MSVKNGLACKSGLAALLAITLTPLTVVMAQAPQAGYQMESNVGRNIGCSEATEAEQYWTPERMQNAQPLPLRHPGSPQIVPQPAPPSSPEVSAPGSNPEEISQIPTAGDMRQSIDCSEAREAGQYWTPERMQNAQPLPFRRPRPPK